MSSSSEKSTSARLSFCDCSFRMSSNRLAKSSKPCASSMSAAPVQTNGDASLHWPGGSGMPTCLGSHPACSHLCRSLGRRAMMRAQTCCHFKACQQQLLRDPGTKRASGTCTACMCHQLQCILFFMDTVSYERTLVYSLIVYLAGALSSSLQTSGPVPATNTSPPELPSTDRGLAWEVVAAALTCTRVLDRGPSPAPCTFLLTKHLFAGRRRGRR